MDAKIWGFKAAVQKPVGGINMDVFKVKFCHLQEG